MDIMHPQGWLRIRKEPKCFVVLCPELRFLEHVMSSAGIKVNAFQGVDHGFHMYQVHIRIDSVNKLLAWLFKSLVTAEPESVYCHGPYAQARMRLFNGLSYPEYDNVSEQEYAAGVVMHARKADTWKCECGRYVLKDGLPCFCGQPAHYSQGLKNGPR